MDEAPKLDWMYAGPAGHVNTDEYLTGRAVDKTFEQFKLGGAEPLNLDLPAPTLPREKSSVSRVQVDVARKVQEDPLLTIRRQEEERRATLREQMIIQQRLTSHNKKTSNSNNLPSAKREKKPKSSDSSDYSDLDSKLALKLKQLKKNEKKVSLDEKISRKLRVLKKKRDSSSASSTSSSHSEIDKSDRRGQKRSIDTRREREKHLNTYWQSNDKHRTTDNYRKSSSSHIQQRIVSDDRQRSRSTSREVRGKYKDTLHRQTSPKTQPRTPTETATSFKKKSTGLKLSEEELEKRRREMMQHAVVRDQERKVKVDNYRKEIEKEEGQLNADRPKEAAFVKKQLANVTANTTVEARIKANVFNIQRSVNSMDSNFARR